MNDYYYRIKYYESWKEKYLRRTFETTYVTIDNKNIQINNLDNYNLDGAIRNLSSEIKVREEYILNKYCEI